MIYPSGVVTWELELDPMKLEKNMGGGGGGKRGTLDPGTVGTIASVYIRYAMENSATNCRKFFLSTIPAKPRKWINLEFGWLEVISVRVKNPCGTRRRERRVSTGLKNF